MVLLNSNEIALGTKIHDFNLPNANGKTFDSTKDCQKDTVLIAFICNHCPYVIKIAEEFSALSKKYSEKVQFIAISSNDPDYREEDSFENMTKFAANYDFQFPYLFDESQSIAKNYGAVCTPDIFVYSKNNSEYKLSYHGRFEDLDKALNQITETGKTSFEQFPSCGCSIKWK